MTDQRNRVTTDPGLGPIEREHASTLRSMTAADPIPEDEIPGSPVYFEPKPLHAVSEHKTLELETVKLAQDIDPRKLPTELKLRRPVLHVLPASDPNWPAPSPQSDAVWPSPQYDSNWPPPETVVTTSQPSLAARRRSYLPLLLFVLVGTALLLLLGVRAFRRSSVQAVAAHAALPAPPPAAPAPLAAEPMPGSVRASSGDVTPSASASALPAALALADSVASADPAASADPEAPAPPADPAASGDSAASANAVNSADSAEVPPTAAALASPAASATGTEPGAAPASRHAPFKPIPPTIANSSALSAPTTKPKRAIY